MQILVESDGKVYGAIAVTPVDDPVRSFEGRGFCCLIWDHDGRPSDTDRSLLASALLDAGCRYVVCGGQHCSAWYDAVDEEWLARYGSAPSEIQEMAHVMTTWHDGEAPDEVAFFFVTCTDIEHLELTRYLVLHAGLDLQRTR